MLSVNTNPGALAALQNLNSTNMSMNEVQNRINTGLKVATAKDNGAIYAIAQNLRADLAGLNASKQSLDRGISTVDVALAAGEAVSNLLITMKEKAVAAADTSLDANSRSALQEDFNSLRDQISNIVSNAEFNGTNMIKSGGVSVSAIVNDNGSQTITVKAEDLSLGGGTVALTAGSTFSTATAAASIVSAIQTSLDNVNKALARMGTGSKSLETQRSFANKLSDTIEVGIGNLVDADMAKESARLQSLQVKTQLGVQALSIANQAPGVIVSLFK